MDRSWVVALFAKLRAIYPKKFNDQYSGATQEDIERLVEMSMVEWGEALAGMTGEQVKAALEYCRDNLTFPPSISEFIKAGKPERPVHDRLLPKPPKVKPNKANIERVHAMLQEAMSGTNTEDKREVE